MEDRAVINRYGFNSDGIDVVQERLAKYKDQKAACGGLVGVNLGKNKLSEDAIADYVQGVNALGEYADYLVINVSSPNTPGLRSLQGRENLKELIEAVLSARNTNPKTKEIPLLVKVAPDLTMADKNDIAAVANETAIDGLIVSNTTISRPDTLLRYSIL